MDKPKTYLIVCSQTPQLKNKTKGHMVMKEISHIVEKGRCSQNNSKEEKSDSPKSNKTLEREETEPQIFNEIIEMEKQVIEIIQTTNNLKIECFKCMDCFKGNKGNKADLKATVI